MSSPHILVSQPPSTVVVQQKKLKKLWKLDRDFNLDSYVLINDFLIGTTVEAVCYPLPDMMTTTDDDSADLEYLWLLIIPVVFAVIGATVVIILCCCHRRRKNK